MVISTKRLEIRKAFEKDWHLFHQLWTDPQIMAQVGFPNGITGTEGDIRDQIAQGALHDSLLECLLVVDHLRDQRLIGQCLMHEPDEDGIAVADIKLLPAFWGHKYGQEIKRVLVEFLFSHTNCRCVEGTTNVHNFASVKIQEAVGAVCIGELTYKFPETMADFMTPVRHYVYRVYRESWAAKETGQQETPWPK